MKNHYSLHNNIGFTLKGGGALYDYFNLQYKYFLVDVNNSNNLVIKIVNNYQISSNYILKDEKNYFGRSRDKFIWTFKDSLMTANGAKPLKCQNIIEFDSEFNKMKSNLICDLLWRLKFICNDIILVHASCVANKNRTILMPAWKGTGKTTACLKLINSGYNFLGDDKVWLSSKGKIYAYPRYIVIKDTNALDFPEFINSKTKLKLFFVQKFKKSILTKRIKVVRHFLNKYFKIPIQYHYIEDLYPKTKTQDNAVLSNILLLTKKNNVQKVEIKNSKHLQAVSNIINIGNIEWNYDLLFLATVHDILFPNGPNWTDEINQLMIKEKNILVSAIPQIKCHEVIFPSEDKFMDWELFTKMIKQL